MSRLEPRIGRALCLFALVASLAAILLSALTGQAGAAVPASPHLRITSIITPTRLVPGDESGNAVYEVKVVNTGAAPTDGSPITLTDQLPAGVSVHTSFSNIEFRLRDDGNFEYPCEVGPPASCTATVTLQPGYSLVLLIPVDIAPSAEGIAFNEATVSGGGAPAATVTDTRPFDTNQAPFGFTSLDSAITAADGSPFTQSGGHPYQFATGFELNTYQAKNEFEQTETLPSGNLRDATVKLPKGFVVDPQSTPQLCTEAQLEASLEGECPDGSAVGVASATLGPFQAFTNALPAPLYNMVPPPGAAAELAFAPAGLGIFIHLRGGVDAEGNYTLTASVKDLPTTGRSAGIEVELWGNPTDATHDYRRGLCAFETHFGSTCPSERLEVPLLTTPSSCSGGALTTAVTIASYQDSANFITDSSTTQDAAGKPIGVDGCDQLEFNPTISARPTTNQADTPTGLDFTLHQPQTERYESLATANLKDARVTLPPGMTLNPSAANGLAGCEEGQIGYLAERSGIHFSEAPQSCPTAAKVGTLDVSTPLLGHELPGAIYVAKPYANPFGSLLAIYLAIEDEQSGIIAKLAGKVEPNPATGQLTATFAENPELPIEDVNLHFFRGPRAPLKTSLTCGSYTTTSVLTPWSTPEGADATPSDSFQTTASASGSGPCPASEAAAPNTTSFSAGTLAPLAGSFSPFLLTLSRSDGSQHITGIDTTLPAGLTGRLAGIPYCSDEAIALAKGREAPNQGAVEQATPSCPTASEVGAVTVGAGAGPQPYYVTGHAYLAGPYKGAPLSLEIIIPAVAGPFDLGSVAVRTALFVDEATAQIHAISDPLPTILQGIPIDLRSIALRLDRPNFTLNPTSCEPTAVIGSALSPTGALASLSSRFQVGGCRSLPFKPRLALKVFGKTNRNAKPRFRAVLRTGPGEANIRRAQVNLPHSEFLEQSHIKTICTRVQFNAGAGHGEQCPKASIYGQAKAFTPLLDKPLRGPVYLRSSDHKLPDIVAALGGQIDIALAGKVDTGPNEGIRNTFEVVPDAPVSKFILELKGGGKGLLVNSEDLCSKHAKTQGIVRFTGQNGKVEAFKPQVANSCKGKGKKQ